MNRLKGTRIVFIALLVGFFTLYAGCSSSGSTRDRTDANTVTGEEASRTPTVRLSDLIQQRVPGINLSKTPDGRVKVRIRGVTSFTSESQPLFVVDGIPVAPEPDGTLPGVTITEIDSIKVYKDPVDTSRWGMRSANGVIVVTTKTGKG